MSWHFGKLNDLIFSVRNLLYDLEYDLLNDLEKLAKSLFVSRDGNNIIRDTIRSTVEFICNGTNFKSTVFIEL